MPTTRLTFSAEATQVFIDVNGVTDHHADELTQMRPTASGQWSIELEIPSGFVGSYAFIPVTTPLPDFADTRERWRYLSACAVTDPTNPGPTLSNAWGGQASVLDTEQQLFGYDFTYLSLPSKIWRSKLLGNQRPIWWLNTQPPDASDPVPWVLLLDGNEWVENLPIAPTLLRMTQSGALPPARYLFISHCDLPTRRQDLSNSHPFWQAVIDELLPQMQENLQTAPEEIIVAGQSLGGLAAVFAVLHYGDTFHKAVSQSGSFWFPDVTAAMDNTLNDFQVDEALRTVHQRRPDRAYLSAGLLEGNMPVFSQAMARSLTDAGIACDVHTFIGGHDRACWFLSLVQGITTTLSGKQNRPLLL